jgi:hypothetical protein
MSLFGWKIDGVYSKGKILQRYLFPINFLKTNNMRERSGVTK